MPRILVIDDDPLVQATIQTLLERAGYDVVLADNGRSGVAALKARGFHVVICDIFMPSMDGLETIRAFNERSPAVPIIAMSGFSFRNSAGPGPDFLDMATKLGAASSLCKPFRAVELLKAVEACLSEPAQLGSRSGPPG